MPAGLNPEWLARTMANCRSDDDHTRTTAWNELAEAIWPTMLGMAIRQQRRSRMATASLMIAEDAAADTFIKLMRNIQRVDPAKLFGWLQVVIRNHFSTLQQQGFYARETTYAVDDTWEVLSGTSYLDESASLSVIARLHQELKRLSRRDRELIYARFWREMTFPEIGAELGITYNAAGSRLKTVCQKLRRALIQAGYHNDDLGATTDSG